MFINSICNQKQTDCQYTKIVIKTKNTINKIAKEYITSSAFKKQAIFNVNY